MGLRADGAKALAGTEVTELFFGRLYDHNTQ